MKFLGNHYSDLKYKRNIVNNPELGEVYKTVIEEYNYSIYKEDYITSFILIQGLYEDRIYVLYRLYEYNRTGKFLELKKLHETGLKYIVSLLNEKNWIPDEVQIELGRSVQIRNRHIHFSFMNTKSFNKDLSDGFYYLFREIDKVVQEKKRELNLI